MIGFAARPGTDVAGPSEVAPSREWGASEAAFWDMCRWAPAGYGVQAPVGWARAAGRV